MKSNKGCKAAVIVDMLRALYGNDKVTAKQLARQNDVSVRSIYRYLDELSIAGIPIQHKRGVGIMLLKSETR